MGSTNDVCISVGYAGFYGLSLVVGSYALLFVSMAAHATQFASLALFENSRTFTVLFSFSRSRTFPYLPVQTSNGHTENASSLQNANPTLPLLFNTPNMPLLSNAPLPPNATTLPRPHPSPMLVSPRKRPSTQLGPSLIALGLGQQHCWSGLPWETAKVTKHDFLSPYFRKDIVVWSNLDWFRCVCPAQ